MKKCLLFLFVTFLISCTNDKNEFTENESSIKKNQNYENSQRLESLNLFYETKDYEVLENNFENLVENLDTSTFKEYNKEGIKYYDIKSVSNENFIGSIIFFKNTKNEYYTKVETYDYNTDGEIIRINVKSKEGDLAYSSNIVLNSEGEKVLSLDVNSINGEFPVSSRRSWWTCARECYVDAFTACYTDGSTNGCADWCTVLLATCWDALGTSCGIWCALDTDNDLTP